MTKSDDDNPTKQPIGIDRGYAGLLPIKSLHNVRSFDSCNSPGQHASAARGGAKPKLATWVTPQVNRTCNYSECVYNE